MSDLTKNNTNNANNASKENEASSSRNTTKITKKRKSNYINSNAIEMTNMDSNKKQKQSVNSKENTNLHKKNIIFDLDETLIHTKYHDIYIKKNKTSEQVNSSNSSNSSNVFNNIYNYINNLYTKLTYNSDGIDFYDNYFAYNNNNILEDLENVNNNIDINDVHNNRDNYIVKTLDVTYLRPGTIEILKWCYNNCNLCIWTSADHKYANKIVRFLFKQMFPNQSQHQIDIKISKMKLFISRKYNPITKTCSFYNINKYKYYDITMDNQLSKNLDFIYSSKDFDNFYKYNTLIIDDNPINIAPNTKNNIWMYPWNYKLLCDDKLSLLKKWLLKSKDKKMNEVTKPNMFNDSKTFLKHKSIHSQMNNKQINNKYNFYVCSNGETYILPTCTSSSNNMVETFISYDKIKNLDYHIFAIQHK